MKLHSLKPISFSEANSFPNWHGCLHLIYHDQCDRTQFTPSHIQAPLKIQRPFYPEGPHVCHSVILHTAGGIVGGDRLSVEIQLKPGAHSLITTAAASKVYGSRGRSLVQPEGRPARQLVQIAIAPGASLEWLPQEVIVFNGAVYRQDLQVELAPGAMWLGWEIVRLGRSARGERFLQGDWRSRTEVWQNGRPLWIDPQWLPAGQAVIDSPHGLAGQPVVGSLTLVGPEVTAAIVEQVRSLWSQGNYQGEAGVTRLMAGLLCRYRGPSTTEVRQWFIAVWGLLRETYLERSPCLPRVWPL